MILLDYLGAMISTSAARLRRGPLRPSWSFLFETSIAFLRSRSRKAAGLSPLEERALWDALRPPPSPVMREVKRARVEAGDVSAEWFEPVAGRGEAVVLFMHGGSFIFGSNESHGELIARLALAAKARVLALEYRLVPEHTFPAPIEDVLSAYAWLREQGVPAKSIVLAGDSAGGNLAIAALIALRERGEPLPAGSIPICPWVDPGRTGGSLDANEAIDWGVSAQFPRWCAAYAGGADPKQPTLSPIFGDLAGLPPLCVLHGECEMLHDQIADFIAKAKAAGVDVRDHLHRDMVHNWMTLYAFTPEAERAFVTMGAFVRGVAG